MIIRPVDNQGDILPVLSYSALLSDAPAVAKLIEDRLNMFIGEWWENPSWGNQILEMLKESRLTESDALAISNYLTEYIRSIQDVEDVRKIKYSVNGRQYSYSCNVLTVYGEAYVQYEL